MINMIKCDSQTANKGQSTWIDVMKGLAPKEFVELAFDLPRMFSTSEEALKRLQSNITEEELQNLRFIVQRGYPLSFPRLQ